MLMYKCTLGYIGVVWMTTVDLAVFSATSMIVLLQYLCDDAVADGFPSISEREPLACLQRNVVF